MAFLMYVPTLSFFTHPTTPSPPQASDHCCDVDGATVGPCMKPCANADEREANRQFKAHIQVCPQYIDSSRNNVRS